jgi:hypothetical protein
MRERGKVHPDLFEEWFCKATGWTLWEMYAHPAYFVENMSRLISIENLIEAREVKKAGTT